MYMGRKGWSLCLIGRSQVKEKVRFCDVGLSSRETKSWINDMRCGVRHESCGEGTRVMVIDEKEMKETLGREEGSIG